MHATTARGRRAAEGTSTSERIALTVPSSALTGRPRSSVIDLGSAKNERYSSQGTSAISSAGVTRPGYSAAAPPVRAVTALAPGGAPGAGAPPCGPAGGGVGVLPGEDGAGGTLPLRSGSRWRCAPRLTLKDSQVLASPSLAASWGPLTIVAPRVPSTSAETTRGETPRLSTVIPRSAPRSRPFSRFAAESKLMLVVHVDGGPASYGSATARSHGSGAAPGK